MWDKSKKLPNLCSKIAPRIFQTKNPLPPGVWELQFPAPEVGAGARGIRGLSPRGWKLQSMRYKCGMIWSLILLSSGTPVNFKAKVPQSSKDRSTEDCCLPPLRQHIISDNNVRGVFVKLGSQENDHIFVQIVLTDFS